MKKTRLDIPAPVLEIPCEGSFSATPLPVICGHGIPNSIIRLRIPPVLCVDISTNESGKFFTAFPVMFSDGEYTLTAVQLDEEGLEGMPAEVKFTISASI